MKINIEVPDEIINILPQKKEILTKIFLLGLKKQKGNQGLNNLRGLRGSLKKAYPNITSVDLQHKAIDQW